MTSLPITVLSYDLYKRRFRPKDWKTMTGTIQNKFDVGGYLAKFINDESSPIKSKW
ncbi:hypothetical protein NKV53_08720 [Legionella sp. 27cVA30]|uniref:hypothetical protein n=1 Tax=Legionella TaxID=445 RepID=UPI00131505D4|nr:MULTISPECIES: hypothetical protein [Legionella]MCP0914421.1 hypothetical protein [Legionella sp. 27cVA30]